MTINPNNSPEAWVQVSTAHGIAGRYEEAVAACDQALQLNPAYALAYFFKGAALIKLNRYKEAWPPTTVPSSLILPMRCSTSARDWRSPV